MASDFSSSDFNSSDEEMEEQIDTTMVSSEEPDVVVVVGGTEFWEYRQSLRSWSRFFDALLRSGMKESQTKRVEFSDKDPKEWELISSLVAPLSSQKVTQENVLVVLPWFHQLLCPRGIQQCEEALASWVSTLSRGALDTTVIDTLLDLTEVSLTFDLKPQGACLKKIKKIVVHFPQYLEVTPLQRIAALLLNHEAAKNVLWPPLTKYIPEPMAGLDVDSVLRQDLLPFLLLSEIKRLHQVEELQAKHNQAEANRKEDRAELKTKLNSLCEHTGNSELRSKLRGIRESL